MDVEGLMDGMVSGSLSVAGPKLRKVGETPYIPGRISISARSKQYSGEGPERAAGAAAR
jgi:hypothetical protein